MLDVWKGAVEFFKYNFYFILFNKQESDHNKYKIATIYKLKQMKTRIQQYLNIQI